MTLYRRIGLVVAVLCGMAAIGFFLHLRQSRRDERSQTLAAAALAGDAAAFETLRAGESDAVSRLEYFIARHTTAGS